MLKPQTEKVLLSNVALRNASGRSSILMKHVYFTASVPCAPFSPDGEEKNKALEKFKEKLETFIKNIEKILEDNGGDWMVGNEFTWADLYVAYVLNQVSLN